MLLHQAPTLPEARPTTDMQGREGPATWPQGSGERRSDWAQSPGAGQGKPKEQPLRGAHNRAPCSGTCPVTPSPGKGSQHSPMPENGGLGLLPPRRAQAHGHLPSFPTMGWSCCTLMADEHSPSRSPQPPSWCLAPAGTGDMSSACPSTQSCSGHAWALLAHGGPNLLHQPMRERPARVFQDVSYVDAPQEFQTQTQRTFSPALAEGTRQ